VRYSYKIYLSSAEANRQRHRSVFSKVCSRDRHFITAQTHAYTITPQLTLPRIVSIAFGVHGCNNCRFFVSLTDALTLSEAYDGSRAAPKCTGSHYMLHWTSQPHRRCGLFVLKAEVAAQRTS